MSLVSLAIVGKDNTPLYLRDFTPTSCMTGTATKNNNSLNDGQRNLSYFWMQDDQHQSDGSVIFLNHSMSLENEFIMFAALDLFEDAASSAEIKSMWIGYIGSMNDYKIYGYLTATKIKIMVSITQENEEEFRREAGLKSLFSDVHNMFIQYTLNPLNSLLTEIKSSRFDRALTDIVNEYTETHVLQNRSWM